MPGRRVKKKPTSPGPELDVPIEDVSVSDLEMDLAVAFEALRAASAGAKEGRIEELVELRKQGRLGEIVPQWLKGSKTGSRTGDKGPN